VITSRNGTLRYSIVVPVYNEAELITDTLDCFNRDLPPGYEVLICYDFEGDSTLPVIAALPEGTKPPVLRLVRNSLGPGVHFAIVSGFREARAPVVVVMMADLSDDRRCVDEMVRRVEMGADVVCASRYMAGGRQIGGPRFKGFLSRMAGVTLHRLAGLPTHDPTNSFKAYKRDYLARTRIEGRQGFVLALELTVKAHFNGGRVEEIPAHWHDRSAGQSRFRLLHWLPAYLRWYFWAMKKRASGFPKAGVSAENP